MKKTRQRIATVLTALLTVGIIAVPAFAGSIGSNGVYTGNDTTINIPKGIVVINDGFTKTYTPNVTFKFSATPATVTGMSVSDGSSEVDIQAGPVGGLKGSNDDGTASVVFASREVVESTDGATSLQEEIDENISFQVDLSKFTSPGVYRYTIEDVTSKEALYQAGIQRSGDYDTTRELDVYIQHNETDGSLEVQGYVLTDDVPGEDGKIIDGKYKVPGYTVEPTPGDVIVTQEDGQDGQPGTADDVFTVTYGGADSGDRYISYNFDITKEVTGNMGDKEHSFPFEITVETPDRFTVDEHVYGVKGTGTAEESDGTFTTALKNAEVFHVYGVNPVAAVTVTETNDTTNTYKVSTSLSADVTPVAAGGQASANFAASDYATQNSATNVAADVTGAEDLTVTNRLNMDSPTGFLMRIAPFAALIALAGVLFGVSKIRTKKREE